MKKLKECKTFAELFETIGEENFSAIAKVLIMVLVASPVFWGMINFSMLISGETYSAYTYNEKVMSLMHAIFSIITLWSFIYYFGKIRYEQLTFKQIVSNLKKNNPWLLPWFALLIWTIIPIIFSVYPFGAIVGATFLSAGYVTHIFMLGIMGCAAMIPEEERYDIFKSLVFVADFMAIVLIAFEINIPFIGQFTAWGGMSVYTNQNHYAYFMSIACLTMVGCYYETIDSNGSLRSRLFYILSFALNIYALMINDTMGSYLAIVFTCLFVLVIWRVNGKKLGVKQLLPIIILVIITVISILGIIPPSKTWEQHTTIGTSLKNLVFDIFRVSHKSEGYRNAGSLRWGIWIDTIEWIKERPITGYGPDIMYNRSLVKMYDTPHNEYLECAFYLGIPGLVLYLGGLFTILINKCKKLKELSVWTLIAAGGAISYLISAFFGVRKFNSVCFFFLFMGFLVSKNNLKKN